MELTYHWSGEARDRLPTEDDLTREEVKGSLTVGLVDGKARYFAVTKTPYWELSWIDTFNWVEHYIQKYNHSYRVTDNTLTVHQPDGQVVFERRNISYHRIQWEEES